jgi:hypothetical protein
MREQQLAKGLGWFSIGLGLTEILAPEWLGRKIGMEDPPTGLLRFLGVRETVTGIAALSQSWPTVPIWGRVLGDVMDLAVLGAAYRSFNNERSRLTGAVAAVLGVTALDVLCARRLQQQS